VNLCGKLCNKLGFYKRLQKGENDMRQVIKIVAISVTTLGLFSCAEVHREAAIGSNTYLTKSQSIPATQIPKTVASNNVPMQTFYPIPPVSMAPMAQTPSTVPPGLPVQAETAAPVATVQAQQQPETQQASAVLASSSTALVLNMGYNQAWSAVGKALHSTGYKVMQQDNGLGAYFVLDEADSGGKLQTTTPIYQVHLKNLNSTTSVTVLDDKNQPANPAVSARILGALKRGL
jgi:uncharacterized lipoprotein